MKKVFAFAALLFAALACNVSPDTTADFPIEGRWSFTGCKGPKGYQEAHRLSYDPNPDDDVPSMISAEFVFRGGKLQMVFPSGAYRTISYSVNKDARTISFDGPFMYGDYGSTDITSCKYTLFEYEGMQFITLYDAADPNHADISKGEWSVSMMHVDQSWVDPLYLIDCKYGTTASYSDLGIEGGPSWASSLLADGKTVQFSSQVDLCTIYGGPQWRLPTPEEAQNLLDHTVAEYVLLNGKDAVTLSKKVFIYTPETDIEYGFWLSDGQALVVSRTADRKASARITKPVSNLSFSLKPVRK